MAAVWAAGLSIYFPVRARRVRVQDGSKFHMEPGKIITSDARWGGRKEQ